MGETDKNNHKNATAFGGKLSERWIVTLERIPFYKKAGIYARRLR